MAANCVTDDQFKLCTLVSPQKNYESVVLAVLEARQIARLGRTSALRYARPSGSIVFRIAP